MIGPTPPGNRRHRLGALRDAGEVDVPDQPDAPVVLLDRVDPDVDDDRALADHVAGDQSGHAGGDHEHIGSERVLDESLRVGGVLVAGDHGGVAGQAENRGRLADIRSAADQDQVEPVVRALGIPPALDHVTVEHVERGGRRRWHEPGRAERQQPRILGVLRLDVLERRQRSEDP